MIAYVILVSIALVMAGIIYGWIRGFVPKTPVECPESSSLFIRSVKYDCSENVINITLSNNGRFSLGGYFIHASNVTGQELAIIDLTPYFYDSENPSGQGLRLNTGIKFHSTGQNTLPPANYVIHLFDLSESPHGIIQFIEITPFRYEEDGNRLRILTCAESRVKHNLVCS